MIYDCNGVMILGGFNWIQSGPQMGDFFRREYLYLPEHNSIIFSMIVYTLDTWNSIDYFQIHFDSIGDFVEVRSYSSFHSEEICGSETHLDGKMLLHGSIQHTSQSLTLKILANLDEPSYHESLAIRELHLQFTQKQLLFTYCGATSTELSNYPYLSLKCECTINQFRNSEGNCETCNESCETCFESGPDNCFRCKDGYHFDGEECTNCRSDQIRDFNLQCKGKYKLNSQSNRIV